MKNIPRLTVGALVFNNDDLLLLKSPKWDNKYIYPCGHVEFMESTSDAVVREVFEETGLKVYDLKFLNFYEFLNPVEFHKRNLHFVGLEYICKSYDRNVTLNRESDSYVWAPVDAVLDFNLCYDAKRIFLDYLSKSII